MNELHQSIIQNYIEAYNRFDIDGMLKDLHPNVLFENVVDDTADLKIEGVEAFRKHAESGLGFFSDREQQVRSWGSQYDVVSIEVDYNATLQVDLPNGMNVGDVISLQWKSVFTFMENQIIMIQDIS